MRSDEASVEHAVGKLWRMALIGVGLSTLFLWFLSANHETGRGRYAWFASLLGPTGLWWLMAAGGLICLALTAASFRLILSRDKRAVAADRDGLWLRSLFGNQHFAWHEVADLRLEAVAAGGRDHYALKIIGSGRRGASLSAATVDGGESALEWWIGRAVEIARESGVRRHRTIIGQ